VIGSEENPVIRPSHDAGVQRARTTRSGLGPSGRDPSWEVVSQRTAHGQSDSGCA
jgi:hypothetical protein